MKRLLLILLLLSSCCELSAQINYSWARRFGGTGNESINKMRMDNAGNIFVIGSYRATVDFDPGPGVVNRTSVGGDDIFFAKYDPAGNFLWVNAIGTASDDLGYDIKIDAAGFVYVCGSFAYGNQSADFNPGPGVANLTSIGNIDAWFGKYDNNGNYVWAHNVASQNNDHGPCLSIDAAGNVYIGVLCSTVGIDFDPGPGVASPPVAPPWNLVIAKYNNAGNYLWCGNLSTNNTWHWLSDMENDAAGNLYVTGYFSGTTNFNIRGGTSNLTPAGGYDACLAAYDPTGVLLWARQAGGNQDDFGQGLAINQANNAVYWTGQYQGTGNFNVSGGGFNLVSAGSTDGFFAKYALATGNYVWAKSIGGTGDDSPADIRLDNCENVYLTGGFDSPAADFDPGPGVANRSTLGLSDVFYAKYSDQGCYLGASSFGGTGSDFSSSIVVNPTSLNVTMSNYFNGTADFDPGAGTANLVSAGAQDAFIAQYTQTLSQVPVPSNTTPPANLTVCAGQTTTLTASSNLCAGGTRLWYTAPSGGGSLASGNSFTTPPITANTTYYVADSICGGISTRLAITVSVSASSAITPTSNSPVCQGAAISLSVTSAATYTWTGPGSYSSNVQNPSIANATAANAGTYSISATSSAGCLMSGTVSVAVLSSSISIQSISNGTVCAGQSVVITPAGATSYTINPGGQSGTSFTVSPAATTQYSITGSNASCIVNNTLTPTISVTPSPTLTVSSNTTICAGQSIGLTVGGASSYTWSPATSLSSASGSSVTATPGGTITYSVTGSTGSCTNTAQTTLSVIPAPTVTATSATVCAGQTATLTASGATSYTWNTGQNTATLSLSPAATTLYTVTGASGGLCTASAQASVMVVPYPAVISASVANASCNGGSNGSITLNSSGAGSYSWSPNNSSSNTAGGLTAGVYTCTLSSGPGCNTVRSYTVTEPAALTGVLSVSNTACGLCNGTASLSAGGGTGTLHYAWLPNGETGRSVTGLCAGMCTVTLSDANGCSAVYSASVQGSSAFTATVSSSAKQIYQGEQAVLSTKGGALYSWLPNAYLPSSNSSSVSVYPMEDATFCVRVTDSLGCVDTACVDIIIKCGEVFIPTAFSPNGDGHNDELKVYGNCLQEVLLRIYDRWGEIVYEGTDSNAAWDGTYKGSVLNAGVFVYQLSAKTRNGETVSKKGNITLVR